MKIHSILPLLMIVISSCSNSAAEKQAQQQQNKVEAERNKIEAEKAKQERDQLLLEKKNNILSHLKEYLPITVQIKAEDWGGFEPGTIFVENKTGYDVEKVVVRIKFIKANGDLFDTQDFEFHNLKIDESQSKPSQAEGRGTKIEPSVITIKGPDLTNGQEIITNFKY